jgi:hypothetical protein
MAHQRGFLALALPGKWVAFEKCLFLDLLKKSLEKLRKKVLFDLKNTASDAETT